MQEIPDTIAINEGVVEEEEGMNGEDLIVDGEDEDGVNECIIPGDILINNFRFFYNFQ